MGGEALHGYEHRLLSCRGLSSQHPYIGSQPSVTIVPGDLTPSTLWAPGLYTHTHAGNTPMHIK